ncbi:hypothetical protein AHAS_Ahas18G0174800 [Arachis hypogaea]
MYLSGLRCICGRVRSVCLCALGSWSSKRWGGGRSSNSISTICSSSQSWKLKRRVEHSRLADSDVGGKWLKWQSLNLSGLNMPWIGLLNFQQRFMILGLGVVAAVLIGTDSQVKVVFSFEKEAKFTDVKALVFLVVANGLAAGYSLIQELRCVVSLVRGSVLFNKPLAWAIFYADQNDPNKTPALSRHKRGCNYKKSFYQKKYCKCFQAGVGCFINCRCDTCKNTFGRKDGVETQPEVEIEACGKEFIENASRKIEIQNSHGMSRLEMLFFAGVANLWRRLCILDAQWIYGHYSKRNMLCSGLVKGKASLEKVGKRLRRSLKFEFDEFDDADLFKDESASGHGVK